MKTELNELTLKYRIIVLVKKKSIPTKIRRVHWTQKQKWDTIIGEAENWWQKMQGWIPALLNKLFNFSALYFSFTHRNSSEFQRRTQKNYFSIYFFDIFLLYLRKLFNVEQ